MLFSLNVVVTGSLSPYKIFITNNIHFFHLMFNRNCTTINVKIYYPFCSVTSFSHILNNFCIELLRPTDEKYALLIHA
jgi:hypothetical protein